MIRIFIICLLLSGCATIPKISQIPIEYKDVIKDIIEKEKEEESFQYEKAVLKLYPDKKQAFLMAFAKVGFDPFEVDKLMTEQDNEDLCVKEFVIRNQDTLLLTGNISEIIEFWRLSKKTPDRIDVLITHIELNYKLYLNILEAL